MLVAASSLSKLINLAVGDQVDERALNFPKKGKRLNPWETKENNNLAIGAAKSIGCSIVNIHATDISNCAIEHREYLMLGMIWQIVKIQLLSTINLKAVPELVMRACVVHCCVAVTAHCAAWRRTCLSLAWGWWFPSLG